MTKEQHFLTEADKMRNVMVRKSEEKSILAEKYDLDCKTVLVIGEFAILWAQAELLFWKNDANPKCIHKWVDKFFMSKTDIADEFWDLYESIKQSINSYLGCIDDDIIRSKILNKQRERRIEEHLCYIRKFLKDDGHYPHGLFLYIYRIRNNMFHGEKDVYTLDKQLEIFIPINKMLTYLLDNSWLFR
jgi:hypothetical protein